ncbi:hypothetical protein Ahy_A07g036562 isoform B [Arachis hypogaea]|uniref:Uncharacterized protein n=1 Tax=Arachis hypogaea TaxID=3818 RepID=A0A445CGF6_ARAHY|nr:hypothetical protein Ahy_A07g036562 isoform B [Arachis hypogaea]
MKTKVRLSKSLNCDATMMETFKYTHTLKENKERFANQRFADHYILEAATQQSQHIGDDDNNYAASEVNPNMIWRETAFESYKNRVYGLGSFFTDNLCTSTLRPSSTSATSWPVDPEESVGLREQVLELTQSLSPTGSVATGV